MNRNKILNKLIWKIIRKNKFKLLFISLLLTLSISIFNGTGIANEFLQKNSDTLDTKYNSYDFFIRKTKDLKEDNLKKLAKKYDFTYENRKSKDYETFEKVNSIIPVSHYDNNNSIGIKWSITEFDDKSKINTPFIIDGKQPNSENEIAVIPQYMKEANKKIGDKIKIKENEFTISGTYSTPQYQKALLTSLTDKNRLIVPSVVNKSAFKKLKDYDELIYAKFNKSTDYSQRKELYKKLIDDDLVIRKEKIEQFRYDTKKLSYDKSKVCGNLEEIDAYSDSTELKEDQFIKLASVIKQAEQGGSCRTTLGDAGEKSVAQLQQANLVSTDVATSVNLKVAQTESFVPEQYREGPAVSAAAQQITSKVREIAASINELSSESKKANVQFDVTDLGYQKYQNAANVISAAKSGQQSIKADASIRNKLGTFTLESEANKGGESVVISLAPVLNAIKTDKATFEKEQAQKKQQIEQKNEQKKKQVEAENAAAKKLAEQKAAQQKAAAEAKNAAEKARVEAANKKAQEEAAAKNAQKEKEKAAKKEKEDLAKRGIIQREFKIKKSNGFLTKRYKILSSIQDFDEGASSRGIKDQIQKQLLISSLLFIIFILLTALLIVIIIQKLVNDNKSEFGVLKALGIRSKSISRKFVKIPIIVVFLSVIMSIPLTFLISHKMIDFVNDTFYLPISKYFRVDYKILVLSIIIPLIVLIIYTSVSTSSLLRQKTLDLINNVSKSNNKESGNRLKKAGTTIKLQVRTILHNKDKSIAVATIGFVITFLISLVTLMYFSATDFYSGVGKELTYTNVNIKKEAQNDITQNGEYGYFQDFDIIDLSDKKDNQKSQKDNVKKVSQSEPIKLNVIAVSNLKSKAYNLENASNKTQIRKGLILPKKYEYFYNIKAGDKLISKTKIDGKEQEVRLTVAGFQSAKENVFTYSSTSYISPLLNKLGKVNSQFRTGFIDIKKDDMFAIDAKRAIENISSTLNKILTIVMVLTIVIVILVIPLITILLSNIIDSSIKNIATLKAIGFNLSSIRGLIINPFLPVFIFGQIIAVLIVGLSLGKQISDIFFSYFGYDVIYSFSLRGMILTLLAITAIYQIIIIISSQRMNMVKTAQILNNDSGDVKISSKDVREYMKTSVLSSVDFNKPTFYFKTKDIPKLEKEDKRNVLWFVFKLYRPAYVGNLLTQAIMALSNGLNTYYRKITIPLEKLTYGATSIISNLERLNIVSYLITPAKERLVQYYSHGDKESFRDTIRFIYQIVIFSNIFMFVLIFLLADMIGMLLGLSSTDMDLFYKLIWLLPIKYIVDLVMTRWAYASSTMSRHYGAIDQVAKQLVGIVTWVVALYYIKYLFSHPFIYIFITYALDWVVSVPIYIISWIYYRKQERYSYFNVSIFSAFSMKNKSLRPELIKEAMPYVYSSFINMPLGFFAELSFTALTLYKLNKAPEYLIYESAMATVVAVITVILPTLWTSTVIDIIRYQLGKNRFLEALRISRYKAKLNILSVLIQRIPELIASIILAFYFKLTGIWFFAAAVTPIADLLLNILSELNDRYVSPMISGGEFKYVAYINQTFLSTFGDLSSSISNWVGLFYLNSIISLPFKLITTLINRKRFHSGRWLYSLTNTTFIKNNIESYGEAKFLERDKKGKLLWEDSNYKDEKIDDGYLELVLSSKSKALLIEKNIKEDAKDSKYGYYVNTNHEVKNNTSEQYQIGSQTKMFTALVILQMIQENKIKLNTKISEVMSNDNIKLLSNIGGHDFTTLSIKSLLTHVTGLGDYVNLEDKSDEEIFEILNNINTTNFSLKDVIGIVEKYSTNKTNRGVENAKYNYSNTGYYILGKVIENIDNDTLENIMKNRIFSKANMTNTTFSSSVKGKYGENDDNVDNSFYFSAGGLVSTVDDMNKFMNELISKKSKLLNSKHLKIWMKLSSSSEEFGSGLFVYGNLIGHYGQTLGYQSLSFIDKKQGKTLIIYTSDAKINVTKHLFTFQR